MKKVWAFILCVMLVLGLAACGGDNADSKSVDVDVNQLADDMLAALDPQGELTEVSGDVAANFYEMGDFVKEYKIYVSGMYIAEEVAVFRLTDPGKAEDGKTMVENRIAALKKSFDGYLPEEFASMNENALVLSKGDIVCFLVGLNPGRDAAKEVFDKAVG